MHHTAQLSVRANFPGIHFRITILIIFLCFFGMYYQMPIYGDDLCFYKDYLTIGQASNFSLEANFKLWKYLWHTDPCRMYNMLLIAQHNVILNRFFGALVLSAIATAFTTVLALLTIKATGRRHLATPILVAIWALLIYRLPWYEFFNATMTYGYILSALLEIFFVQFITSSISKNSSKIGGDIATAVFAFICGWMHEGLAIPIGVGLLMWAAAIQRFRLPARIWIAAACFAGGIALDVCSPMIAARLSTDSTPVRVDPVQFIRTFHLTILTAGIWCVMAIRKRTRLKLAGLATNPVIFTLTIACLTSIAMWTKLPPYNPGVTFLPHTLTILFLMCTLATLFPSGINRKRDRVLVGISTFAVLTFNVSVFAKESYAAHQNRKEFDEIFTDLTHGETGTVFRDVTDSGHPGFWSLAPRNLWRNKIHVFAMNQHEKRPVNVVPAALRDFAPEKARVISGSAHLFDYNGILVAHDEPLVFELKEVPCEIPMDAATYTIVQESADADTPSLKNEIQMFRFKFTDPHGNRWLYLQPEIPVTANQILYAK